MLMNLQNVHTLTQDMIVMVTGQQTMILLHLEIQMKELVHCMMMAEYLDHIQVILILLLL
jgi:hypothetical protein